MFAASSIFSRRQTVEIQLAMGERPTRKSSRRAGHSSWCVLVPVRWLFQSRDARFRQGVRAAAVCLHHRPPIGSWIFLGASTRWRPPECDGPADRRGRLCTRSASWQAAWTGCRSDARHPRWKHDEYALVARSAADADPASNIRGTPVTCSRRICCDLSDGDSGNHRIIADAEERFPCRPDRGSRGARRRARPTERTARIADARDRKRLPGRSRPTWADSAMARARQWSCRAPPAR
jgi:hypothetical protein